MSTWFSLYVHDAEPEVCSRDGRVWIRFLVDGGTGAAPHTVVLMLKSRASARAFGEALVEATIEPPESDDIEAETLANA